MLTSNKNKNIYVVENFEMRKGRTNKDQTIQFYRCLNKNCKGRGRSDFGSDTIIITTVKLVFFNVI